MTKAKQVNVTLDPNPKGAFKKIGGSLADDWNQRLGNLVASALPIDQSGDEEGLKASRAVYHAMIDMKPDDPIEGMLIGQLMAAKRPRWGCIAEHGCSLRNFSRRGRNICSSPTRQRGQWFC